MSARSRSRTYKVLVQDSDICIDIARYINKNITMINDAGTFVRMEKLEPEDTDDQLRELLQRKGIKRLPALLSHDGTAYIGLQQIIDLFEKDLRSAKNQGRARAPQTPPGAEMGTDPDLAEFWMRELYSGCDPRGKPVPREDKDEDENESKTLEKAWAAHQRRAQPRHRVAPERDIDTGPAMRRRQRPAADDPPDNIADDEADGGDYDDGDDDYRPAYAGPSPGEPRGGRIAGLSPDAMDEKMMAAWLQNNPSDT